MPVSSQSSSAPIQDARQLALSVLQRVRRGTFADAALEQGFARANLSSRDRALATELIYGSLRRQRTLDALIDQLGKKSAAQQPPDLRLILHLGFYQLRYLDQIPASAAVDTTVNLAKQNGLSRLAAVVNGILRQYIRRVEQMDEPGDVLQLPTDPIQRLGVLHSFPDWIVDCFNQTLPLLEVDALCDWLNRPPTLDLRVNPCTTTPALVAAAFQAAQIAVERLPHLPQALRLSEHVGAIQQLPGYHQGWWSIQDGSAQLVAHLVDPQPGETIIDACAAPGGKATHLAELMGDRGRVIACDRAASRLKKVAQNSHRLKLNSIEAHGVDSTNNRAFQNLGDRVLVDAPCSGLGTLHRHADARWRQTPDSVAGLTELQQAILNHTATWVKPGGLLVYATCTLHPAENEAVIQSFLNHHSDWQLEPPMGEFKAMASAEGWIKRWPHRDDTDGFFMARLRHQG